MWSCLWWILCLCFLCWIWTILLLLWLVLFFLRYCSQGLADCWPCGHFTSLHFSTFKLHVYTTQNSTSLMESNNKSISQTLCVCSSSSFQIPWNNCFSLLLQFSGTEKSQQTNAGDGEEVDIMFVMMLECKQWSVDNLHHVSFHATDVMARVSAK